MTYLAEPKMDCDISSFDSKHQKLIRSGAITMRNVKLMLQYLRPEEYIAFINTAMVLDEMTFERKLVRFAEWSAERKQALLDIWFLYDEAILWAGYHAPEDEEFTESCDQARDQLLKRIWGQK